MFHGWKVVICAFMIAVFGWGLGFYGVGVFLATLSDRHGWPTSLIASAITAYYILGAVLVFFVGNAFERFGPRVTVLVGMVAMGIGALGLTRVWAQWQLFLVFPLMSVGWACMSGAALNIIVAPWFERRRGLAVSLVFNGAGFGGMVVVPLLLFLIERYGFGLGVLAVAIAMAAILIPLTLAVLHRGPEVLGLAPDGEPPSRARPPATATVLPYRDFLGTWHFWTVSLPFSLGLIAQVGFLTHQVSFLTPSLGTQGAGWAVSLTTFSAVTGRLLLGLFVDRINRRVAAAGNFLMQTCALLLMLFAPGPVVLYIACAVFGLGVGNMTSLPSLIVQTEFPKAAFVRVVGTVIAINQFFYAFGPGLLGWLYSRTGDYAAALILCAALLVIAGLIVLSPLKTEAQPSR